MFIVEVLLVYILHGYCHWRLFSCVLLGGAAHPLQCIKCRSYHLYCSCHQSLFKCDLVEGSRELFIADDITRLHGYHRQSRLSCSFVGVRRLVYMALVVKFVLVRLCFGRCGTARHLWQYVQVRAPLWVFRGESLALLWIVIHSHTDIIP